MRVIETRTLPARGACHGQLQTRVYDIEGPNLPPNCREVLGDVPCYDWRTAPNTPDALGLKEHSDEVDGR